MPVGIADSSTDVFIVACQCWLDVSLIQGMYPVSILPEDVEPEVGLKQLLQQVDSVRIDGHTCTATGLRLSCLVKPHLRPVNGKMGEVMAQVT